MYIYMYILRNSIQIYMVKLNDKHTTIFYAYIGGYMGLKAHISFVDLVEEKWFSVTVSVWQTWSL